MINFKLEPITENDLPFLRTLRNRYRFRFIDSKIITMLDQKIWYQTLGQNYIKFYVAWSQGLSMRRLSMRRLGTLSLKFRKP